MTIQININCEDLGEALQILEELKAIVTKGESAECDEYSILIQEDDDVDDEYARDFLEGKALLGE